MIVQIKCQTCNAIVGTIDKPVVTDEDIAKYQEMVTCENGHQAATLEAADEE